jgi:Thioesterase domain
MPGTGRSLALSKVFSPASRGPGRRLAIAALLFSALILIPAAAHSATRSATRETESSRPHVYLMRGLLNIFSLGMDQLAVQIRGHGIDASVYNHSIEQTIVGDIEQKYHAGDHGPYILVGHSLGADAVMVMAAQLNAAGVPVALVVPFDGTGSYAASANVACVLNVTQRKYAYMRPGTGFRGKLRNVDVSSDASIDHFTIDKSPRLQAVALTAVLQAAHEQSCRPGGSNPVVARPKETPLPKQASPNPATKQASIKRLSESSTRDQKATPVRNATPVLRPGYAG